MQRIKGSLRDMLAAWQERPRGHKSWLLTKLASGTVDVIFGPSNVSLGILYDSYTEGLMGLDVRPTWGPAPLYTRKIVRLVIVDFTGHGMVMEDFSEY